MVLNCSSGSRSIRQGSWYPPRFFFKDAMVVWCQPYNIPQHIFFILADLKDSSFLQGPQSHGQIMLCRESQKTFYKVLQVFEVEDLRKIFSQGPLQDP